MKQSAFLSRTRLIVWLVLLMTLVTAVPGLAPKAVAQTRQAAVVASPPTTLTAETIVNRLLENNSQREARLRQYSVPRTYQVKSEKGKVLAETKVVLRFHPPGRKEFKVVSETGSGFVRGRVFKPLMESEVEAAAGGAKRDSSITPHNYDFALLGEEDIDGYHCYVLQATPKRDDKYLFRAKLWVHATEFAIVRIAGQPARSPSFWIKRVDFVRRYQKAGEFWLPLRDESVSHVRILGKYTLMVDYDQYQFSATARTSP